MAHLDNPKSIALLFSGAFLISLAIIAFLNVEMESRSSHGGAKIKNQNVFELIGRKISDTVSSLRERNAYRRSILYSVLISGNATRIAGGRRLLYFSDRLRETSEEEPVDPTHRRNRTFHRIRHEKKIRRLTEPETRQQRLQNETTPVTLTLSPPGQPTKRERNQKPSPEDDHISVYLKSVNNQTLKWVRWTDTNNKTDPTTTATATETVTRKPEPDTDVLKEKFSAHVNCYTMNDVLEIIAITCLVNFIFWFMIITCVNVFTRNQRISKSESCESLASIGTCPEYEVDRIHWQKKRCGDARPASPAKSTYCRHSFVQEYVDSLDVVDSGRANVDEIFGDAGSDSVCRKFQSNASKGGSDTELSALTTATPTATTVTAAEAAGTGATAPLSARERRRRTQLASFPNVILDMISLDNVKPFGRKKPDSDFREKTQTNLINSLSMENLIF